MRDLKSMVKKETYQNSPSHKTESVNSLNQKISINALTIHALNYYKRSKIASTIVDLNFLFHLVSELFYPIFYWHKLSTQLFFQLFCYTTDTFFWHAVSAVVLINSLYRFRHAYPILFGEVLVSFFALLPSVAERILPWNANATFFYRKYSNSLTSMGAFLRRSFFHVFRILDKEIWDICAAGMSFDWRLCIFRYLDFAMIYSKVLSNVR